MPGCFSCSGRFPFLIFILVLVIKIIVNQNNLCYNIIKKQKSTGLTLNENEIEGLKIIKRRSNL